MTSAISPHVNTPSPFQAWAANPSFEPRLLRLVLQYLDPLPPEADTRWLCTRAASSAKKSPRQFTLEHFDSLDRRASLPGVKYCRGRHIVFELAQYPNRIFKIFSTPSAEAAKESLDLSTQTLRAHPLKTCFVPEAQYFDLENGNTLIEMSKATGILGEAACREESEREFELFDTQPELIDKWRQFFRDAAEFICCNFYTDSGWHNMVLNLETGITFVDFESRCSSREFAANGLKRLLEMTHPFFFDDIIGCAERFNCKGELLCELLEPGLYGNQTERFKAKRQRELDLRSQVRGWHKKRGIIPTALIAIQDDFTDQEKRIVAAFNEKLAANLRTYRGCPVEQRCLTDQILFSIPQFSSIEDLETTLEGMKAKGILFAWDKETDNGKLTVFSVYF